MKRFLWLCAVMLALPAAADTGWWQGYFPGPSSANPMGDDGLESVDYSHPDVELVRQDVTIYLEPIGALVYGEFVFRNHGAAQTVPMYFPLSEGADLELLWDEETYPENSILILQEYNPYNFDAWVRREDESEYSKLPAAVYHEAHRFGEEGVLYADYARYDVSFAAGEELQLNVEYFQHYSSAKHNAWLEMYYPVDSGGGWRGPIGSGVIEVYGSEPFDFFGRWQYSEQGLPPAVEGGGEVRWEFTNLEPKSGDGVTIVLSGMATPWGVVVAEGGVNFRTAPDPSADRVAAHPLLSYGERFYFLRREGDWLQVLDGEMNPGWLRWRYVEGGNVEIYALLSPDGTTNNLPLVDHDW